MWFAWLFFFLLVPYSSFASADSKILVVIGDSLTEGYGVARDASFPVVLEKLIQKSGKKWKVLGAGISGATSASAPSRVRWQLKSKPDLVVLALGSNDALRGLEVKQTEANLAQAIEIAQAAKVKVALATLLAPPNYGKKYTEEFAGIFPRLQKKYSVTLLPFLLDGVAGDPKMNIADGIHPNEKGHQVIAQKVFEALKGSL